ncbi:unnamed protein product [Clonostachys rosea]|uniref:Uncharacterized protein n=1 Tax=Bionectria ochroleuca TaxID=29856 RepID=A0ABY6V374_BIOOC|nr:unnamed protein product [Clonostachys rosea]
MFSDLGAQNPDAAEGRGGADQGEDETGHIITASFYGRACTNCYAVKCRCEYLDEGGSCLRFPIRHTLGIEKLSQGSEFLIDVAA